MYSHPSLGLISLSSSAAIPMWGFISGSSNPPPANAPCPVQGGLGLLQGVYPARNAGYRARECQGGNWSPTRATGKQQKGLSGGHLMPCYVQRCQGLTLSCLRTCSLAHFSAFSCSKVLNMYVKLISGSLDTFPDSSKTSQQ